MVRRGAPENWHALSEAQVLAQLDTDTGGLSAEEARRRLTEHGPNEIEVERRTGPLVIFFRQIHNPLIWVLLGSCAVAIALGQTTDGFVIGAVVLINSLVGFVQEFRAERAIEALAGLIPERIVVVRDGVPTVLPASGLVPGDIVRLSAGDRIPADVRLLSVRAFRVQEAALTGESEPVEKTLGPSPADAVIGDRFCMAYGGTVAVSGTATAVVAATGASSELGRISSLIRQATDLQTPLTRKLSAVGRMLTIAILAVTAVILIIGTLRATAQGIDLQHAFRETLIFSIALAVGAIPEGLPAIVTIALAIGVRRMAKRGAIVRRLPVVETLGSTTVICSDKTGTLTRNEMTVEQLWTLRTSLSKSEASALAADLPSEVVRLLEFGALCNDADLVVGDASERLPAIPTEQQKAAGDPTEVALLEAAASAGRNIAQLRSKHPRLDAIPFDSSRQFMATLHGGPERRLVIKGSPEAVLRRCTGGPHPGEDHAAVIEATAALAGDGLRVLALAEKPWSSAATALSAGDVEDGFLFVGLVALLDPPRPETMEAVRACQEAGIVVKMITGDHVRTAESIGARLGISSRGRSLSGKDLAEMKESEMAQAAGDTHIFARVAPEHKLQLVRALQANGAVVAMTGDGVNDAPALKQANVGVAMGLVGTSVAREAADIVLADDNFATIRAAVEEGRRVYDNLVKSLVFLLPTNLGIALTFVLAIVFFPFDAHTKDLLLPMTPAQLLWINMVAAVALALPFAFEAKEPNLMKRGPRRPDEPLFGTFVVARTIGVSMLLATGAILLFLWLHAGGGAVGADASLARSRAQSVVVTFIIVFQIAYMLNCRSLSHSMFRIGVWSNPAVFVGIATVLLLQIVLLYAPWMNRIFGSTPLTGREILLAVAGGFLILPIIAVEKWLRARAP